MQTCLSSDSADNTDARDATIRILIYRHIMIRTLGSDTVLIHIQVILIYRIS